MNHSAASNIMIGMKHLRQVVRQMYDYRVVLWGDPSRDIPFLVVKDGFRPRRNQVRPVSGKMPSASCCVELHERGFIEMEPASEGGEGRRYFHLTNSGLALAARTF